MRASVHHLAIPEAAVPETQLASARGDWVAFLGAHLAADWRPDEWNAEHWLFTGNPDNPGTRIYRCSSAECDLLTDTRNGPCASCRQLLRQFAGNRDVLAQHLADRPSRVRRIGGETQQCLVTQGSQRCSRTMFGSGLCETHLGKWRHSYMPKGLTVDQFLASGTASPLAHFGWCLVPTCARERASRLTSLCQAHEIQFKRHVDTGAKSFTEDEFAVNRPPIHARGNFSLIALPEPIRHEYLVAIQAETRAGYLVNPPLIHRATATLLAAGLSMADVRFDQHIGPATGGDGRTAFFHRASSTVRSLRAKFEGVDPTAGDVWDSFQVGLPTHGHRSGHAIPSNDRKFVAKRHKLDFTPISQEWLRELVKLWAREMLATTSDVHDAIRGFSVVSDALALRGDGEDPKTAKMRDIQKSLELLHGLRGKDGELYSTVSLRKYWTAVRRVLHYLRAAGHMDHVHPGFAVTPEHRVARGSSAPSDDEPGRALPNRVINALLSSITQLPENKGQTGSFILGKDLLQLHRAALRALIDTGRRPGEIISLKVGCVSMRPSGADGVGPIDYTLTYDNHKAGRKNRTIPITVDTATALLEWEAHRRTLKLPKQYDKWLFPSPSAGRSDANRHLSTGGLARALARLVMCVATLEDDVPDVSTGGYLRFRGDIVPYSMRHSYAQRHADAGVDPDTLRELMDHRSIVTTMGYYRVSAKRKREAIAKLAPFAVDQHGHSAPFDSPAAYEISSVAVPFGGCTDPTNVKAGGSACPIRFQCAGCAMYRPDPSYLPAIDEHLRTMRATLQMVLIAGTAAPWVVQNQRDEIASFETILESLKQRVEVMSEDERDAINDASSAMRKVRANRPLIPLTVRRSND